MRGFNSIGHQASRRDEAPQLIDGRKSAAGRGTGDLVTVSEGKRICDHERGAVASFHHCGEYRGNFR